VNTAYVSEEMNISGQKFTDLLDPQIIYLSLEKSVTNPDETTTQENLIGMKERLATSKSGKKQQSTNDKLEDVKIKTIDISSHEG